MKRFILSSKQKEWRNYAPDMRSIHKTKEEALIEKRKLQCAGHIQVQIKKRIITY